MSDRQKRWRGPSGMATNALWRVGLREEAEIRQAMIDGTIKKVGIHYYFGSRRMDGFGRKSYIDTAKMLGIELPDKKDELNVLRAATHELLMALESIETLLASHPEATRGNSKVHFAMHKASAAIAKARGGVVSTTTNRPTNAPDLLEALENVTAELRQLHAHHYGKCEGGCPAETYIAQATEAIAKAKGGQ